MKNQIKIGAILSYASVALNLLSGLLYTPWMVQQIGKSDYGLYTLVNSLITLFLVDFGLSAAASRYIAKYVAEGNSKKANEFTGMIYKLYLLIDAVILIAFVIVFFNIEQIYVKLTPSELEKFKVVYIIAAGYALFNFPFVTLNGILTAYEKFIELKLAEIFHRVFTVVFTIAALLAGLGLYALVTVSALSGLATILLKFIIIWKKTPIRPNLKVSDKKVYASIFSFSFWTTVSTISQRLIFNIIPTILGIVSGSAEIAVFGIVTTIEQYSYLITSAINGMFLPKVSRIYAKGDSDEEISALMLKVGRFQFALNGLIVVGFMAIGKTFIKLWMGPDYLSAYNGILFVIIPGVFFNSLQIANTTAIVKNKIKEKALVDAFTGVINVVFAFIMSYKLGMLGACCAIFVSYTIRVILYHIIYRKKLNLDIVGFIKNCYFKMLPVVLITIILAQIINRLMPDESWLLFAIKGFIIVIVYAILLVLFVLDKEGRINISRKFKRVLNYDRATKK